MLRSSMFTAIAAAFGILASGPVLAQTPDGETPALEAVCDELKGGSPGLYGLCVAYCEAQDLDEMVQEAKAGDIPGERILEKYRAKMKAGDPDMPCLVSAPVCPCLSINECTASTGAVNCQLDISGVGDVFAGLSCSSTDLCINGTAAANDICVSSGAPVSFIFAQDFGNDSGICSARAGGLVNVIQLDGPTAQICVDAINAYDGNGESSPNVSPCLLGN